MFVLVKGKVVGIDDGDTEPVIDLVNGFEDGIPDLEPDTVTEAVGKLEGCTVVTPDEEGDNDLVLVSETDTVGVVVKGKVVGIADFVIDTVTDFVAGLDEKAGLGDTLVVIVLDGVTVTVVVGVNGKEVGIGDFETVTVVEVVGKLDGWTVVTPDEDGDSDLVLVNDIDTVGVKLYGNEVGIVDLVIDTVTDLVAGLEEGFPEGDTLVVIVLETVFVTLCVIVKGKELGITDLVIEIDVDLLAIFVVGNVEADNVNDLV